MVHQRYLLQYEDQSRRCTQPTFEDPFKTYTWINTSCPKCRTPNDCSDIASDLAWEKNQIYCPKWFMLCLYFCLSMLKWWHITTDIVSNRCNKHFLPVCSASEADFTFQLAHPQYTTFRWIFKVGWMYYHQYNRKRKGGTLGTMFMFTKHETGTPKRWVAQNTYIFK